MKQIYFLSLFFTGICTINSYGQTASIDTLRAKLARSDDPIEQGTILLSLADAFKRVDLNQVRGYIQKAAAISEYAKQPGIAAKITYMYGVLAARQNKMDSAKIHLFSIFDNPMETMDDSSLIADAHYELGDIFRKEGLSEKAINHLQKSIAIDLALNNERDVAASNIILGIIYKNSGLYSEAIEYYQNAFEVYQRIDHTDNMATCILNIANVYTRQQKYDEALEKYQQAIELAENLDDNDNLYAFIYGNMSNLYSLRKEFEQAFNYAEKSYELRKSVATPEEQATSLIGMANNLNHLDRSREALNVLMKAREIISETSGLVQVKERIAEMEYKIYERSGQPTKALEAVKEYLVYYDSLRKTELEKQALELNTKYETERKEQEIALLNADHEITEARLTASRRQTYFLIGGLLIAGFLGFFIFLLYRKTQSQNNVIQKALNEKDILLREIHHRVKNNLQFISSLLGLQSEHVSDVTALSALQEGQDRVQSMALIHQNLYQEDNLTGVEIKGYFIKLIRNLFDSYNIRKGQIQLDLDIETLNLDVDTVIPIGLIVNELVSNSLKYAFKEKENGMIEVSLRERGKQLVLQVRDNGKGMSQNDEDLLGKSFGYRLIHVFKDQLNAVLNIANESGTTVTLKITKYRKVA